MSQTTVVAGGPYTAIAGQLGDASDPSIDSGINAASTEMPFGYGIRDGSGEREYLLATGFSGVVPIVGVNLHQPNAVPAGVADPLGRYDGNLGGSGLRQYADLDILRKGSVYLPVEAAITKGDRGWCRGVATGALTAGSWRGAAPGAAAPLGGSYHVDCTRQVQFRSASVTSADGTTLVALAEVDFVNLNSA